MKDNIRAGKILWDIDKLESNGYIGLIRILEPVAFLGKNLKWGLWTNF